MWNRFSSSSSALSCYLKNFFGHILHVVVYFLLYVEIGNSFNSLIQLPKSGLFRNSNPSSSKMILNVNDFGAKGDGITDDTKTFQDIWKLACSSPSPAKIIIPARNSYLLKPIDFSGPCKSKVTVRISGEVVAPRDPTVWDGLDVHKWLYFHGVQNLTVEGGGVVDGMGQEWWDQSCKRNKSNPCSHAPTAVTFHKCKNLKLRDVSMVNGQQMHVALTDCMHVSVSRLTIMAPSNSPNTDGVHISTSAHVELKDVVIGTGDDCISIVSNSSQIRIKNIICGPGHGISIGSLGKYNSYDAVQDIIVDGAVLFDTENGVRIKTWQGGSGFVRKVTFEDIWMHNVSNPLVIDQYYCDSWEPCLNQTSGVRISNISFRGIIGTSATEEAIQFSCSDSCPCKELFLEDIQLVSLSGIVKSFCWEAYGTSLGILIPPSCISSEEKLSSGQKWNSVNSKSLWKDE